MIRAGELALALALLGAAAWPSALAAAAEFNTAHKPIGGWTHLSRDPTFAGCQKQADAKRLHFDERRAFIRSCTGR